VKHAVVFYFSGTGNTRYCALKAGRLLADKGISTRVVSIESLSDEALEGYLREADLPVFAYPIYGSDMPDPMKAFFRCLPGRSLHADETSAKAAVFCTQWLFSGDGAALADEELLPRGMRAVWTAHIPMPNNICLSAVRIPYTNDPGRLASARERADLRLEAFVDAIVSGKPHRQGRGHFSRPLGLMQRKPYRKYLDAYRSAIAVDPSRCTLCGRCVRLCPVDNLSIKTGAVKTAGRCVFCMRCYDFCPESAITFLGKPHDLKRGVPYKGPEPGFRPENMRGENAVAEPIVKGS
jgi:ferredoxin